MSLPDNHPRLRKRPFSLGELVADAVVHVAALLAGIIAFSGLLSYVLARGEVSMFLALSVYAAGFFLLFSFSLAYNMAPASPLKWLLRRFDHSAIYIMIAGTYTAILSQLPESGLVWLVAAVVWAGAVLGVFVKLALPGRHDGVSLLAYVALGAMLLVAIGPMRAGLPGPSLWLLLAGGVTYVAGVGFYRWHTLLFHNALWHLCVAVAAGLQFAGIAISAFR